MRTLLLIVIMLVSFNCISQVMTVTYRGPESDNDKRMEYPVALLTKAMELTKKEYGDYILIPSIRMNAKRAQQPEIIDKIENYIIEASVSKKTEDELFSIKIPTTKGLYGYRLFLIDSNNQYLFNNIKDIEDLKKIRFGQGSTWFDVKILNGNGLNVVKGLNYRGLLKMLMSGRFDAFPRGMNEVFKELSLNKASYANLAIENNLCIYYPLPKFFYTSKKSLLLNERVTKGLSMMIENGSFDTIFDKYNSKYILEAKLHERTIIKVDNNFISGLAPLDDPRYWFVP